MEAPGGPGISPTWTSSAKDMVGVALGHSRLWFTVGYGIVNEVYFPRIDIPQIRDLGLSSRTTKASGSKLNAISITLSPRQVREFPPCKSCTGTSVSSLLCASCRIPTGTCSSSNAISPATPTSRSTPCLRRMSAATPRVISAKSFPIATGRRSAPRKGLLRSPQTPLPSVVRGCAQRRLCRYDRWLAGLQQPRPDDLHLFRGRPRQYRADRRARRASCSARARLRRQQ